MQYKDPLLVEGLTVPSYCSTACESADSHAQVDRPGEACLATDSVIMTRSSTKVTALSMSGLQGQAP